MGSLTTFGDMIEEETNIEVRTIDKMPRTLVTSVVS